MSSNLLARPQLNTGATGRLGVGGLALLLLAWLLATLPLPMVGLLIGGVGGGLLLLRHPWLIWPGIALLLPVTSGIKAGPLSVTDLLLAGAVALWFVDGVRRRALRLSPAPLPGWIAPYLAALLLSTYAAADLTEAAREVIKWVELLLVVWLVGQTLTPAQSRWLVLALLVGGAVPVAPLTLIFFVAIGALMIGLFSQITGLWARKWDYLESVQTFIFMPFVFLSGVFFSIDEVSARAQPFARANPVFYLVDGIRFAITGRADADPWVGAVVCITVIIVLWVIVYRLFAAGYRMKS